MDATPSSDLHRRRSLRLADYDYGKVGAFFLTMSTLWGSCTLADIVGSDVYLTGWGEIVQEEWLRTPQIRPEVLLDEYVVMPNHFHAVVVVVEDTRPLPSVDKVIEAPEPTGVRRPARSLGSLVAGFKISTTKRINVLRGTPGAPFWQRNYYEHVVRNDVDMDRIRTYIRNNPLRWSDDEYNPSR